MALHDDSLRKHPLSACAALAHRCQLVRLAVSTSRTPNAVNTSPAVRSIQAVAGRYALCGPEGAGRYHQHWSVLLVIRAPASDARHICTPRYTR